MMMHNKLIVRQMFEKTSSSFTYLLIDADTKEGVLIDTVKETVERDLKIIKELDVQLEYILDTHAHADHITGAGDIRTATGARTVIGYDAQVPCADIGIKDGETLKFGSFKVKAIATPGHTKGCISYLVENMVFTGDALLIRGNGRTDFQEGSPEVLYQSITEKLFTLPEDTIVYPAHNYIGLQESSIKEEKMYNPRIAVGTSLTKFVKTMNSLELEDPKQMDIALPANQKCGVIQ